MHEDLVPPHEIEDKKQWAEADWKTEYDVVKGLKKLGHQVEILGLKEELGPLRRILYDLKPKIVFNLLEEFAGQATFDQHIVSYLEMNGVKYTGCHPRGLMLARDKALAKKIFKYHRIPTPDFLVFRKNKKIRISKDIKYPLFVKSLSEEASLGITQDSIVTNAQELKGRVEHFHSKIQADAIAETYIEGRELYVGVLGNERLQTLPIWELYFDKASDRVPRIATRQVKWNFSYREKIGIRTGAAQDIPQKLRDHIYHVCKRAYKALDLSGYARMDLRVNSQGEVFIIEANPNPDIGFQEDLAASAEVAGMNYHQLLDKILRLGLSWQPM